MLFSKIIAKKFDAVWGRYEGDPAMHYDTPAAYPGLQSQPFPIMGDKNVTLQGAFYYYGTFRPEKLIVFDHGISAGHLAYLKEIDYLAQHGYTVYSYDHTGCVATGGEGIRGFAQGVNDLDHVLTALQKDARFAEVPRKIIGHSWGGYSCMNVVAFHPEVTHVVSLAGFLSARALSEQYIPKMFLKYSEEVMARERQRNPRYADLDARESMQQSKAHLMHVQSRDDNMVKFDLCCAPLSKALAGRANTEFVVLDGHGHDPQRTTAALAAYTAMETELNRKRKHHQLDTPAQQEAFRAAQNWVQIDEQDEQVWQKILDFLAKD